MFILRYLVYRILHPLVRERRCTATRIAPGVNHVFAPTQQPTFTGPKAVAGYYGWLEFMGQPIAFRREDGSLQFRW